jgi:hypothetical protein
MKEMLIYDYIEILTVNKSCIKMAGHIFVNSNIVMNHKHIDELWKIMNIKNVWKIVYDNAMNDMIGKICLKQ